MCAVPTPRMRIDCRRSLAGGFALSAATVRRDILVEEHPVEDCVIPIDRVAARGEAARGSSWRGGCPRVASQQAAR